jgi:hypothetical protein
VNTAALGSANLDDENFILNQTCARSSVVDLSPRCWV